LNTDAVNELKERTEGIESKGFHIVVLKVATARAVLDHIAELEGLRADVPLAVGDRVHEAGYPDETGEIIGFRSGGDARMFTVKRDNPGEGLKTINYYREELILIERAK
jgi:hypothetical protein